MPLTPRLHSAHVLRAAEIATVLGFLQPALLTGFLARCTTGRFGTILLLRASARMRVKQPLAATASTALILLHRTRILLAHIMPRIRRTLIFNVERSAVFYRRYSVADAGSSIGNTIPAHPQI